MFSDYDSNFIDNPYFEVKERRTLAKLDAKNRPQSFTSVLCGGSKAECADFLHEKFGKVLGNIGNYTPGATLSYTDERGTVYSIEIEELG